MAEGIRLTNSGSDEESSDGSLSSSQPRRKRRRRLPQRGLQSPLEIIDLTGDDSSGKPATVASSDLVVIDLTEAEETPVSPPHDDGGCPFLGSEHTSPVSMQHMSPLGVPDNKSFKNETDRASPWDQVCKRPSPKEDAVKLTCCGGCFSPNFSCGEGSVCGSPTTFNSDLGSLGSPQLTSPVFSPSSTSGSSSRRASLDCPVEEAPSSCQPMGSPGCQHALPQRPPSHPPSSSPSASIPKPSVELKQSLLETSSLSAAKSDFSESINKDWLYSMQYFRRVPVHHPFLFDVVQDTGVVEVKRLRAKPIPHQRLSMVSSTIDEKFSQGTLEFLMDFVSHQYYPPKEIMAHVIQEILLSSERREIRRDAYMLLMKIQAC
uniref:SUMO interacting motifs containing 1 n=1 Tax=Sphenodon punctatus TaxID=8508 RepID=A0A8D0GQ55_SPHPU